MTGKKNCKKKNIDTIEKEFEIEMKELNYL